MGPHQGFEMIHYCSMIEVSKTCKVKPFVVQIPIPLRDGQPQSVHVPDNLHRNHSLKETFSCLLHHLLENLLNPQCNRIIWRENILVILVIFVLLFFFF